MDKHLIKRDIVVEHFVYAWRASEGNVDMEVAAALAEKSDNFEPEKHITTMKKLLETHLFAGQQPVAPDPLKQEAILVDQFNLDMKRVSYDEQAYSTWRKKCEDTDNAVEFMKMERRLEVLSQCKEAAQHYLANWFGMFVWEKETAKLIAGIMDFKREVIGKKHLIKPADVPAIVLLNHAAPSLVPADVSLGQFRLLSWALMDNMESVGLAVAPVFCYQKG
eukprot:5481662-Karenia_brevis.AAC.1